MAKTVSQPDICAKCESDDITTGCGFEGSKKHA